MKSSLAIALGSAALVAAQGEALIAHRARRQRVEDRLRRASGERVDRRRAWIAAAVARPAGAIEERGGVDRLPLAPLPAQNRL